MTTPEIALTPTQDLAADAEMFRRAAVEAARIAADMCDIGETCEHAIPCDVAPQIAEDLRDAADRDTYYPGDLWIATVLLAPRADT